MALGAGCRASTGWKARSAQSSTQAEGVGFPLARVVVVICLATGAVIDAAIGPHSGKGNSEFSLRGAAQSAANNRSAGHAHCIGTACNRTPATRA